jgi:hypothetical protein
VARDAHNATWRALTHVVKVLLAHVGTQLTADAPAGLNVTAPVARDYYVMPTVEAVRAHAERNHHVQVYVMPTGQRVRHNRTQGPTGKSIPSDIEITIAVRVSEEAGAADYTESGWKTLTPKERELARCETLMGAIQDAIDGHIRGPSPDGDDIINAEFIDSTTGDERFRAFGDTSGTWSSQRWLIKQIINVPVQTS